MPECPAAPGDHDFLPVKGHPDDDECTYRSDGTDATYCGRPAVEHDHHPNCYQSAGDIPDDLPDDLCDCRVLRTIDAATRPERTKDGLLPCCRGEGECQAPPDIGPCDPLPSAENDATIKALVRALEKQYGKKKPLPTIPIGTRVRVHDSGAAGVGTVVGRDGYGFDGVSVIFDEPRGFEDGCCAGVEQCEVLGPTRPIPPAACACGHPSDDHDDEGACMHLCDCAWPIPPAETTKEPR